MKNIKPTWFIEHPIDQEHKQYILLDFLQSVNKDIEDEDVYYPIKKIFSMIKNLTSVKVWLEDKIKEIPKDTAKNIRDIIERTERFNLNPNEKSELLEIIDSSLGILYKYADMGMSLWRNIEGRIKTFNIREKGEVADDFGILILRNMATDHVTVYWWQLGKTDAGSIGTIMKRVRLSNDYFSMSYEFLIHETLESIGLREIDPRVTVMEIFEDFNEDSVTLKIAKELFIREIGEGKTEKN